MTAAAEALPAMEQVPEGQKMPNLPETFIEPFGAAVQKVQNTPEGDITLVKIFTPGHNYTIKFNEEQTDQVATAMTGGIKLASAIDLSGLRP